MQRYLFDLPLVKDALCSEEVLSALDFWRSYPALFSRYAKFASERAKEPGLFLAIGKPTNEIRIALDYRPGTDIDQSITLIGEDRPRDLVQFFARVPDHVHKFSTGYQYLCFVKADEGRGTVVGEISRSNNDYEIKINRFQLPRLHDTFEKLLANQLELRNIDSRSFILSSGICRSVAHNYQKFWTTNSGVWSNCLIFSRFAKEFPHDAAIVADAEISCAQLEVKLNAEIMRQQVDPKNSRQPSSTNDGLFPIIPDGREEIDETCSNLGGQGLTLFRFLVDRKHKTSYDTLLDHCWDKPVLETSIQTALERLATSLNKMEPQRFSVVNEFSNRRVCVEPLFATTKLAVEISTNKPTSL